MAASLILTPKTSLTGRICDGTVSHILICYIMTIKIVIISSVIPENLVLLTKIEHSGPKSVHIRPTISSWCPP